MTAPKKTYDHLFKILLIGDPCVLFRFVYDEIISHFKPLTGVDFKVKTIELGGKKIKLQIWDTEGQERFRAITTSYYRGARGIMLVYDIRNAETFDSMSGWLKNIEEHAEEGVVTMLVGSHCEEEDRRQVDRTTAEAFAKEHDILFLEVSAKANINVENAFMDLTRAILDRTPDPVVQPKIVSLSTPETESKKTCF